MNLEVTDSIQVSVDTPRDLEIIFFFFFWFATCKIRTTSKDSLETPKWVRETPLVIVGKPGKLWKKSLVSVQNPGELG